MRLPAGESPNKHIWAERARALVGLIFLALAAGVLAPWHGAKAAGSYVQSASNQANTNTIPVSFGSNVKAGNVIAVGVGWSSTPALTSITDNCGIGGGSNTYVILNKPVGEVASIGMAYAVIGKSGACTVSAAIGAVQDIDIVVHEITGVNTAQPLDAYKVDLAGNPGTGTDALSSGNLATQDADYIFAFAVDNGSGATLSAGTGFTSRESLPAGAVRLRSEDRVRTSAGAFRATFTTTINPGFYFVGTMAFLPAAGVQVSSRSDALADPRPSATSNHTFTFTTNAQVTGSSTITLAFPAGFTVPADCGDIDAATSSPFNFNYAGCAPTATAWGAYVAPGGADVFVQRNANKQTGGPTQFTVAFNNNVTAGNLIVVAAAWDGAATVLSVTDTLANVYTAVGPKRAGSGGLASFNTQLFYAKNIAGGAATVAIKLSAAANTEIFFYIHEYTGADTLSPLDATSSNVGAGLPASSGSAATHAENELIFGMEFDGVNVDHAGDDFTMRSSFDSNMTEDRIVNSMGTYDASVHTANDWILYMATFKLTAPGRMLVLTAPTDSTSTVHVATGTPITIKVGSNATQQQQGGHWITNPSSAGIYTISVGGTFGGSGNMLVSINGRVQVSAAVAESLALTVSSVNAVNCTADDGATVNSVTSTATSVPFGTVSLNAFSQGCQDLVVSTNAGNGYSLTVQESSAMKTANGAFTIPDTTCDAGGCTESAAAAWTNATKNGLGHTCFNQDSNHDCNSAYFNGTLFRQLANIAAGETAQAVMSSSTAATATGRMKYRLSAGNAQSPGTYTTIITYIITGTY
jgi:hypothetical protein